HRIPRRPPCHHADARWRGPRLQFRYAPQRTVANLVHTIPAHARTECDVLGVPDAYGPRDVRERHRAISHRADAAGQWRFGKLSDVEATGSNAAGNAAVDGCLLGSKRIPIRTRIIEPRPSGSAMGLRLTETHEDATRRVV